MTRILGKSSCECSYRQAKHLHFTAPKSLLWANMGEERIGTNKRPFVHSKIDPELTIVRFAKPRQQ